MTAICIDDEALVLELTVSMCKEMSMLDTVEGFQSAKDALDWLDRNTADVAIVDIDMPDMSGMELATALREKSPDTAIIFQTGYAEYAVQAFDLRASGYLLKPVNQEKLRDEILYALRGKLNQEIPHILVRTFGDFDVFVDGKPVSFSRSKAKELLAYLVDRQGGTITRADAFAALYEDEQYDRAHQKQFDVIIRSLRQTLVEYGVEDMIEMQRGSLRAVPENFSCDLYHFLEGQADAVNAFRGEYMSSYLWASTSEGYLTEMLNGGGKFASAYR